MSRIPSVNIPAPAGHDLTSDPVQTSVGKAQLIVNMQCNYAGKLRGLFRLVNVLPAAMPHPIDGVAWYYQATITNPQMAPFLTDLLLFFSNGILYYSVPSLDPFNVPFSTPVPVAAANLGNNFFPGSVFVNRHIRSAALNDELIFVQDGGVQPQRFFSGAAFGTHYWEVGIVPPAAPATAQTGTGLTGTYSYKQTFYDERKRESSPSPISTPLTITNKSVQITITWGANIPRAGVDRQIKGSYIYRNTNGGFVWYRVADVGIGRTLTPTLPYILTAGDYIYDGAANDDSADATISAGPICPNPGEYDVPNPASIIAVHKNRVFLNDVTDNSTLQISVNLSATQFTSFPASPTIATDGVRQRIGSDQGDPMQTLVSFGSVLAIFKRRGVYYLWGDDLNNFSVQPVFQRGCISPDSVVRCNDVVMFLSDEGVFAAAYNDTGGETVRMMSQEINKALLAVPQMTRESSIAWFRDNRYHLAVGPTVHCYDFTAQGWTSYLAGSGVFDIGIPGYPPLLLTPPYLNGPGPGIITMPDGTPPPNTSSGAPPIIGNPFNPTPPGPTPPTTTPATSPNNNGPTPTPPAGQPPG